MKKLIAAALLVVLAALPLAGCAPETLLLYTDLNQSDAAKLVAPFTEKTGVQVEIISVNSSDRLTALFGDLSGRGGDGGANTPAPTANPKPPDLILTKDMFVLPELAAAEALESYMPQQAADLPYGANGGGYWYGFGGHGWVLAWNTSLVQKPPESYQDLASTVYPIKSVTMQNPERSPFYALAVYSLMGEDYTMNLFRTLLLNEVYLADSPGSSAGLIAKGEYQVGITTYQLAKEKKDGGSPIDFVFPDQGQNMMGAYVEFYSAGIPKGGRHLKAAKQLDDWLLSPEAEKLSVELGLSDVTLRECGSAAPVVVPLKVDPANVMEAGQSAQAAFDRMARGLN